MKLGVRKDNGEMKAQVQGEEEAILAWCGEYQRGDVIVADGLEKNGFYHFRADDSMEETLLYVTGEKFTWIVPFYEKKTNRNPLAFLGAWHCLSIRKALPRETAAYRNLAFNPADQHDTEGVYPHVHANAETRGDASFAAQNVIDGYRACLHHGEWPFQSWGTDRRKDAALTLEFGRPVDIDTIVLYLRADFPHDAFWDEVNIRYSDGSRDTFHPVRPVGEGQRFQTEKKGITWLCLEGLHPHDDSSPFPSLTQLEVYGADRI